MATIHTIEYDAELGAAGLASLGAVVLVVLAVLRCIRWCRTRRLVVSTSRGGAMIAATKEALAQVGMRLEADEQDAQKTLLGGTAASASAIALDGGVEVAACCHRNVKVSSPVKTAQSRAAPPIGSTGPHRPSPSRSGGSGGPRRAITDIGGRVLGMLTPMRSSRVVRRLQL